MERGSDGLTKLTGIVDALERDQDDDDVVISVEMVTLDDDDYLVGDSSTGDGLLDLVGEMVEAEGIVSEDEHGDKVIAVRRYTVLDKGWDA